MVGTVCGFLHADGIRSCWYAFGDWRMHEEDEIVRRFGLLPSAALFIFIRFDILTNFFDLKPNIWFVWQRQLYFGLIWAYFSLKINKCGFAFDPICLQGDFKPSIRIYLRHNFHFMFVDESHTEKQVLQYFNLLLTKTRKKNSKKKFNFKQQMGNRK